MYFHAVILVSPNNYQLIAVFIYIPTLPPFPDYFEVYPRHLISFINEVF